MSSIQTIRNLGPAMETAFARAGIHTAEELREIGVDTAYARAIRAGMRPHFAAFLSLCMGLQGRGWNDAQKEERNLLRQRFDRIKDHRPIDPQSQGLPPDLHQFLNRIGLREAR